MELSFSIVSQIIIFVNTSYVNLIRLQENSSTFSVRATTVARMATSTIAPLMATGGLLLLVLLRTVTTWLRTRRMSALRITITAGTVLPFAVWYGRDESGRNLFLSRSPTTS